MLLQLATPRQSTATPRVPSRNLTAVAPLSAAGPAVDFSNVLAIAPSSVKAASSELAAVRTAQAEVAAEAPRAAGSFLAELEQEVRSLSVPQGPDRETIERNTRLANTASRTALDYWTRLVEHLNVLKPSGSGRYVFDGRTVLEHLPGHDFRVVPKLRTAHSGEEHFESVTLSWRVGAGGRVKMVKEFPVDIERLRARLSLAGINAFETQARDLATGRPRGLQFEFTADISASVRITPLHDEGKVRLALLNIDALQRTEADFPAFAIRPGELDDIARLICGRANKVLTHAQNLVRHEP